MWTRNLTGNTLKEQSEIDAQSISMSMRPISFSNDRSQLVFDQGHGDPIIFIPTVSELHFVYAPQLEEFGKDYRVILYDPELSRRSFVRVSDRAEEVKLLIKHLGVQSAHIVAWSDAGSVAYHLAKTSPELCRSVIFLGLSSSYKYPEPLYSLSQILLRFPIENVVPPGIIARILAKFLGGPEAKSEWIMQRALTIPQLTHFFKYKYC